MICFIVSKTLPYFLFNSVFYLFLLDYVGSKNLQFLKNIVLIPKVVNQILITNGNQIKHIKTMNKRESHLRLERKLWLNRVF